MPRGEARLATAAALALEIRGFRERENGKKTAEATAANFLLDFSPPPPPPSRTPRRFPMRTNQSPDFEENTK